ncbi:MAG: glucose-1-phosphate cytidylyltransferase [Actinomycetota bacterium]
MKVGILAGGKGSRLSEETVIKPKPMVEIGDKPILWHIMAIYAHHGFDEFAVALGYKGDVIKRYMLDVAQMGTDVLSVDLGAGTAEARSPIAIDWKVDLVETGPENGTGSRMKQLKEHMGDETCMVTWGDGVSDVDLTALLDFHRSHGKLATMTAVRPPARYGHLELDGDQIAAFSEKPQIGEGWINGAFFVLEPEAFDYINDDPSTMWEGEPLERLAADGQLMAYRHHGFWQCMDTVREKFLLERLWESPNTPWAVWER